MKRLLRSLLYAVVTMMIVSLPVLATGYSAPLTIVEDDGNAYPALPVSVTVDNQWLADNGFMDADALDTAVETLGGATRAHMVVDDRLLTWAAVPANSQTNLYYTTGNTPATDADILVGYGGYITLADAAALELGNNGGIEIGDCYIDHDEQRVILSKDSAIGWPPQGLGVFEIVSTQTGSIVVVLNDGNAVTPDNGTSDPDAFWTDDGTIDDDDTGTGADAANTAQDTWTSYLISQDTGTSAYGMRTYCESDADWTDIDVDAYYGAAWHDVYQGAYSNTDWDYWFLADGIQTVTNVRVRFYNSGSAQVEADLFREIDLIEVGANTHVVYDTAVPEQDTDIEAYMDGVNLYLDLDGVNVDSDALGGHSLTNNGDDWILYPQPYWGYYEHTVAGTLIVNYDPEDIIIGTTLPDLEGAAQDGAITFGTNPAGVTVTLGSMTSQDQPEVGSTAEDEPRDVLPAVGVSDWFGDGTVTKAATLANPFRSFITAVSDNTTLSEIQTWRWLGVALLLMIVVATARGVRGHQGITAIVAGAILGGLVAFDSNIFPLWLVVISIGCLIGGIIAERSPSL